MDRAEWVNGMQCLVTCSLSDLHFSLISLFTQHEHLSFTEVGCHNSTEKAG